MPKSCVSDAICEIFIELVRKHRTLYDQRCPEYKDGQRIMTGDGGGRGREDGSVFCILFGAGVGGGGGRRGFELFFFNIHVLSS